MAAPAFVLLLLLQSFAARVIAAATCRGLSASKCLAVMLNRSERLPAEDSLAVSIADIAAGSGSCCAAAAAAELLLVASPEVA